MVKWSKTQTTSLLGQVNCGVREFDLRPHWTGSSLVFTHGDVVIEAARGLASHVAKTTCFAEIEKARLEYQRVTLLLSEEESRLKEQLQKIQNTTLRAKRNLDAALEAASLIEKELMGNQPG